MATPIELHLHIHVGDCEGLEAKIDAIADNINLIKTGAMLMAADLSHLDSAVSSLEAAVAADTALDQSAITLLDGLAQILRDNAADEAAINALADRIDAANTAGTGSNAALADAITRNTPAAPTP